MSLVVFGVEAAEHGRPAMSGKMIMSAPRAERYTASVNQLNGIGGITDVKNHADVVEAVHQTVVEPENPTVVDMREEERNACINNNIGIGNTFVWASRNSDTSDYASMVEDTNNPQNNVCFVRVGLKSDDSARVSVDDVPAKYFMWGENIKCGSWADEKEMEQRILDARKGARIGGIVAASVGGAGVGVGAMELFGNELIGGGVQGQKADKQTMYKSYLEYLSKNDTVEYNKVKAAMKIVNSADFDSEQGKFINNNK